MTSAQSIGEYIENQHRLTTENAGLRATVNELVAALSACECLRLREQPLSFERTTCLQRVQDIINHSACVRCTAIINAHKRNW